ncbi:MAG: hypothetical protein JO297_07620 [Nitrososphaeraceae archaeon]|nr:hypothetical protein [Nitrososphaeraceae archaeon]
MKHFGKKVEYSTSNRKKKDFKNHSRSAARSILDLYLHMRFLIGCTLVSIGICVSTSGGSWDITNHLLNKPETFFSAPHAILYSGVALAMLGSAVMFQGWRQHSSAGQHYYTKPKISIILVLSGIAMLVVAGPIDFSWHSAFGLDGLLSPPHFILLTGMIASSTGSMLGINLCINRDAGSRDKEGGESDLMRTRQRKQISHILTIISVMPVWISLDGLIGMFSLPFSNTQYFHFNPDASVAAVLATIAYPFLISLILCLSFRLGTKRFGILSVIGAIYLMINIITVIIPNESLILTLPFYLVNIIPIIIADTLLSVLDNKFYSICFAGAIVGSIFLMIQYPLITHIYNEVFTKQPVWPSLTSSIYFGMISKIYPLIIGPAIAMGMVGAIVGYKIGHRITSID